MKSMFKNSVLTLLTNHKFTSGQSFLNLNMPRRWQLTVSISSIDIPQRWADTGEHPTADQSNHWHVYKSVETEPKMMDITHSAQTASIVKTNPSLSSVRPFLLHLCTFPRMKVSFVAIWRIYVWEGNLGTHRFGWGKKREAVAERRQGRLKEGEVGTRQRTKAGRVILSTWPAGLRVNEWNVVWGPFLSVRCHSCHSVCRLTVTLTEIEEEANITEGCQGAVSQLFFRRQVSTRLSEAHKPASSSTVGGWTGSLSNSGRLHTVRF